MRYEGDTTKVIADAFGGRLNSPNDLYVDVLGRIWFSDPRYGEDRSDLELDHESVYRADPEGGGRFVVRRMTEDTTRPNGLLVSSDLRTLYVAQSEPGEGNLRQLRAYPIRSDGELAPHELLYDFGPHRGIDGMCFDAEGNVVATAGWDDSGPGSMIYVFSPKGEVLERHPTPVNRPTNCTFGDDDLRTLYVTTTPGILLQARTDRRGSLDDPRAVARYRAPVEPRV